MGRRTLALAAASLAICGAAEAFVHGPIPVTPMGSSRPSRPASLAEQRRASTVVKTWVDTKVGIEVPADPARCYEVRFYNYA